MSTFNALYIKFILAAGFNKAGKLEDKECQEDFHTQGLYDEFESHLRERLGQIDDPFRTRPG